MGDVIAIIPTPEYHRVLNKDGILVYSEKYSGRTSSEAR